LKSAADRSARTSDPLDQTWRRALVIRIGALGDVLLTRRLCYSLSLGGYRSTLLAPGRHASLLLADPWIDAILDSESPPFAGAFAGSWPAEGVFDLAVLISKSRDLEKAARLAATNVIRLSPDPERDDEPIAQQWADAARAVCVPFTGALPLLATTARDAITSGATLIHPGSGSRGKNWPMERFAELRRRLEALGHRVVWIRGPAEPDLPAEIPPDRVIDQPSLRALAATLARSKVFIGNDSGVSHLAGAAGAPTLVLFGPTSASVWRPDGPRVHVVPARRGKLAYIQVEDVVAAADNVPD
jgi:ADP-heptose:LPS heptosyltransferase